MSSSQPTKPRVAQLPFKIVTLAELEQKRPRSQKQLRAPQPAMKHEPAPTPTCIDQKIKTLG